MKIENFRTLFEEKILKNLPFDLRFRWERILTENKEMYDLSEKDIKNIMLNFDNLSQESFIFIRDNDMFLLKIQKIYLRINLCRRKV